MYISKRTAGKESYLECACWATSAGELAGFTKVMLSMETSPQFAGL